MIRKRWSSRQGCNICQCPSLYSKSYEKIVLALGHPRKSTVRHRQLVRPKPGPQPRLRRPQHQKVPARLCRAEISEFEVTPPQITYYCVDEVYVGPVREGLEASLEQTGQYTFRSVHFPSASAELQTEALPELKELAAYLQKHPGKKAEIAGHTDDVGQAADNQQLSEARAKAVRVYLASQGVASARLMYRGYGEQEPIASNDTAAGRRRNRRVECVLK